MNADLILCSPQVVTCAPGDAPRPGSQMGQLGIVAQGAVAIEKGVIVGVGSQTEITAKWSGKRIYHKGALTPGLVDPHSHPLFGGSRVHEFQMRARGATYQEIHAAGGGIWSTVQATRQASDEQLRELTAERLRRMLHHGTTTAEVKSGYGLSVAEELRHLKIYQELKSMLPMELVLTFMGAHSLPQEFAGRQSDYVKLVVEEMVPAVAAQGFAEYGDVFCEVGAFTVEESRQVLQACKQAGLGLRIHAEEFNHLGGARMAAGLGAASVDHLQFLPPEDFPILRQGGSIPVMTAGTSFFLGMSQFAPARGLIEANLPLALGSDFNAGSCLSESMQMAMSLGVLKLGLSPEEALLAATVNSAHSLGRGRQVGSLEVGKRADVLALNLSDVREWPYHYGVNVVEAVYCKGARIG
ncbi:MAG: imidazolonepropionase [Candidatus Eremiobacteraeota bacterium]|nr:imidazolonepropionase [Candidatus Eremiobacteraeota bacterium]MCW5867791.1 imidazolonepropionase [Candidatus Eremiobacteraeota bacterium]